MKGQDEKERNNYSLSGPIVVATFMMFAFVEAPNKKKCHCLLCAALCPLYVIRVQHFLLSELSQYFNIFFFKNESRIQQFSIEIPSLLHLRVKYPLKKLWNLNTKFVLKVLSIYLSLCLRPLHQLAPIWVGATTKLPNIFSEIHEICKWHSIFRRSLLCLISFISNFISIQ